MAAFESVRESHLIKQDPLRLRFENNVFTVADGESIDIHNCQLSICNPEEATDVVYRVKGKSGSVEVKNLTGKILLRCFCIYGGAKRKILIEDKPFRFDLPNGLSTISQTVLSIEKESGVIVVENYGESAIYVVVDFDPDEETELFEGDRIIDSEDVKSFTYGNSYVENDSNEIDISAAW